MDFVVHDATQHYCVIYTRLCVQLRFTRLYEQNATTELTGLPFEWQLGSLYSTHLEENKVYILHRSVHAGL